MESGGTRLALEYEGDARRAVRFIVEGSVTVEDEARGGGAAIEPVIAFRPTSSIDLRLSAIYATDQSPAQYVGTFGTTAGPQYLMAHLSQTTAALTLRADYTVAPTLSFQLYAQPFMSAGGYETFRLVRNSSAARFNDRFETLPAEQVGAPSGTGVRAVDADGDGSADFSFGNPDFNLKQLNSTAVLRWEYRPGSALFAVWGHGREHQTVDGRSRIGRDAGDLFGAPGTNVLMIKASYWLGL